MSVDIDPELVNVTLQTLTTLLSPDKTLIEQGQQHLKVLQVRKEYVLILVNVLLDKSSAFGLRQLAGVLFKQYIEVHWSQNAEKFEEPEVDAVVKARVKQLLPIGLNDASSKLRTQVSVAIAIIGSYDWPEAWPQLFEILVNALNGNALKTDQNGAIIAAPSGTLDLNAVHGALETLIELVPDITDAQMPQVAPVLMPQMYKIFIDPANYSIGLRKRAVQIFAALVEEIAEMCEYDKSAGKKYLFPYVGDYIFAMIKLLSLSPAESANIVDYSLKKEIIKVLTVLLKCFPKKLNDIINEILTQVWNCLVQSSETYVTKVINADSNQASSNQANNSTDIDFEDEKTSFENLIYQLFEFIQVLKEKNKFKATIKKAIDELCYFAILYMQINDDQLENWSSNPEQFVQDEDDESYSYSVRISAQELIENIAQDFKKETSNAMSKAVQRHMENAEKMRAANDVNWWKIHEACLLAVSAMKPVFQELLNANSLEFNLNVFVNQFVIACLHESNYPFLVGRALFTASRFPKMLNAETLETLLKATGSALHESQNPIIRISAMKSAYCFADELTNENQQQILIPHLGQITEGLVQMIVQNSGNQIATLTMETLVTVLAVDDKFVESVEAKVSPLAIALFVKNTNDPLVNSIITDIIKTLINNSYTYSKIEQRMMPTLIGILNSNPKLETGEEFKDLTSLLTSTLDLITTFVRSSPQIPLSDQTMSAFVQVANLCLKTDDSAILQNGGECLRAYVSKSIDQLVNWKDERGESALGYIVRVITHMLDPKTNENSCSYVGKFITTVIRRTAHVLGDAYLESILKAVLSKIQSSQTVLVQQSLIMVFAHLVHTRMQPVLTFLSGLPGPTGQPVLEFLMTEWVNKQANFVGSYEVKVSILALAKILEHAISTEDTRFQSVYVRGDRIINPVEGIKTRSKSKSDKESYTQVPLLVKIYKLLINETHNLIEEKRDEAGEYGEEDEENGDEDVDYDDEEDDEKDGMEDENESENVDAYLNKYDIFEDAFDKDDYNEFDPDALEDPLIKIDLLEYLKNYLSTLSKHPCYNIFSEHHNSIEKQVLKEIGITNA